MQVQGNITREFYANCAPNPRFKRNQHLRAELVPFAAHEVRDTGLRNAEALGRIRLRELVFLDVEAKVAHQIRPHLEHGGLGRINPRSTKTLPLDLVIFFFMIRIRRFAHKISGSPIAAEALMDNPA